MGLNVDRIIGLVANNTKIKLLQQGDYSTKDADAQRIHEFLTNKTKQQERKEDLIAYLLQQKDENGNQKYTLKEAKKAAKQQLKNEKSQLNAQVTKVYIDKAEYDKAVAEAKQKGTYDLYNFSLIKDQKLLNYIKANPDKFYRTDESGNYVFDSDLYKNDFSEDVHTDNKLQLAERKVFADRRGIAKKTEANAVRAAGLDVRRDYSALYKSLAGAAAIAAVAFGGASARAGATATAGSAVATATASASSNLGRIIGGGAVALSIPFLNDRDGKTNKRQDAADLFIPEPEIEEPKEEVEEKDFEDKPVNVDPINNEPTEETHVEEVVVEAPEPAAHSHKIEANYVLMTKGVGMSQYVAAAYGVPEGSAAHKAIMKKLWEMNPGLRNTNLAIGDKVFLPDVELSDKEYKPDLTKQPQSQTPQKITLGRYTGYIGSSYWAAGKEHVDDEEHHHHNEESALQEDKERLSLRNNVIL